MSPGRRGSSGRGFDGFYEHRPRRPGPSPPRPSGRRAFGTTWWGAAWVDALEQRARLDPNRLPRGRTYARSGAVGTLQLAPGEILAPVQGSRSRPYDVRVRVRPFSTDEWDQVLDALAAEIGHTAALLDGELPPEIAGDVASVGLDLLPGAGELQPRCSCPDWADPCKHAAAVCYLVADALDADPFGVLLLRGRSREDVLAALRLRRGLGPANPSSVPPVLDEIEVDNGVPARARFAAAAAARATAGAAARPPLPRLPLPPARPGRPTVLALDPPPGSGIDAAMLEMLAADAAARAHGLATATGGHGLELSIDEDLARRAAALIAAPGAAAPGAAAPGALAPAAPGPGARGAPRLTAPSAATSPLDLASLALRAGVAARELLTKAVAYAEAGPGALAVLEGSFDPDPSLAEAGRALLGPGATLRKNRVTLGARQLRLGPDGRWYPFSKERNGTWAPAGPAIEIARSDADAEVD